MFQILLCTLLITLSACSRAEIQAPSLAQSSASPSPTQKVKVDPSPTPNSSIRSVDFGNVAYPDYPEDLDPHDPDYGRRAKRVTLKAREGEPYSANYGDVTRDGIEEAMVVLGVNLKGSAITAMVYIFSLQAGQPKLLWHFQSGDRADGGLRQIYAENSQLVIELYGKNRIIGGDLYRGEEGLCCPSSFTRTRYEWRSNRFVRVGQPEVFPNPEGNALNIMPEYRSPRE